MAARHAAPAPSRRGTREWLAGVGALLLLLGLVVGIPAVLIAVAGVPFGHGLPSWTALADRFRGPDNGQLLQDILLCLAWAGWATFTLLATAETVALARHTVAPTLAGLAGLQPAVGRLVAAAALLLPASGAALHLGAGAVQPPSALTAPLRPAATTTLPITVAVTAGTAAASPITTPAIMTSTVLPVYVVGTDRTGERDTLWSIAARHLGNPLRWKEIAQLNYGERQGDGGVFTDPALIRNGWKLRLPADATGLPRRDHETPSEHHSPAFSTTHPHAKPRAEPPLTPVPVPVVAPPDPTPVATRTAPSATPPPDASPSDVSAPPSRRSPGAAIPLGPGSEISGALAAALLLAFSLRRLRRRQHYQPRPPRPGQLTNHPPLPPPLRQLLTQSPAPEDMTGAMSGPLSNASPPGSWQLGTRDEHPVQLSWEQSPVLSFTGAGAAGVVRALVVTALLDSRAGTDILAVGDVLGMLSTEQPAPTRVLQLDKPEAALQRLQLEVLSRSRLLAETDLPDAAAYRRHHPEDPLPALLLLVTDQTLADQPALNALLHANAHLDIVALTIGDEQQPQPLARICVAADGDIASAEPAALNLQLTGVRLYRLTDSDAATLLQSASPADKHDTIPPPRTDATTDIDWTSAAAPKPPAPKGAASAAAAVSQTADRPPIRVQLLGPIRLWVHDVEVTTGLRRAGRELLAWYLLHPEGRPTEAAVDALWPDDDPDRGRQRFWNALTNLRARLRSPEDITKLQILGKSGDNYQPQREEFDVDLWTFQAALQAAGRAGEHDDKLAALRRAVAAYTGPFAADTDFLWAEPIREECHRRALDAHVAYATLLADTGNTEHAISTLEHALTLDPYAEDLYRRLIRLHHATGRKESIRLLWRQLGARLADIDSEPQEESYRLYRQCT